MKFIVLLFVLLAILNSEERKENSEHKSESYFQLDTLKYNNYEKLKIERDRNYLYTYPPFPHPTKGVVRIKTFWDQNLPFKLEDIELYNISGQLIKTKNSIQIENFNNYSGYVVWDASSFKSDIYFIKIKHGTEIKIIKILII